MPSGGDPSVGFDLGEKGVREERPPLPSWADWIVRLVAIAILLALAGLVLASVVDSGSAGFAAGAIVLALILIALPLARLARLRSVNVLGVGIELESANKAMGEAPTAELAGELDDPKKDEGRNREVVDLQLLLEAKLAYVAKHVVGFEDGGHWSSFLTVGSLKYDDYLSKEDAIAARRLLGLRPADFRLAREEDVEAYLQTASAFVRNVRATVFENVVRTVLEKDFEIKVGERSRDGGKRPDLELRLDGPARLLVFPAFAGGGAYWTHERIHQRALDLAANSERALIVVPPNVHESIEPAVPSVGLVNLKDLVRAGRVGEGPLADASPRERLLALMPDSPDTP